MIFPFGIEFLRDQLLDLTSSGKYLYFLIVDFILNVVDGLDS